MPINLKEIEEYLFKHYQYKISRPILLDLVTQLLNQKLCTIDSTTSEFAAYVYDKYLYIFRLDIYEIDELNKLKK
jgi:hypothetical protein